MSGKLGADPEDGGLRESAKLADQLGNLYSSVASANVAPNSAQKANFAELQRDFQQLMPEALKFINEGTNKLNDALRKANAPTLMIGKPIELPR